MVLPTVESPHWWIHWPRQELFVLPPYENPLTLPVPQKPLSLAQPFHIPDDIFNAALDLRVPLTIAGTYAVTATLFNYINKSSGYQPWYISKTRLFHLLVVLHNIFLAVYSAWTSVGMFSALWESLEGSHKEYGTVGVVDALCKMNGPRGLGNAAYYNTNTTSWLFNNSAMKLLGDIPDSTDRGRYWNEGLAFYGWLFYLSKFYEVVDTAIILAKGKKSSLLQTYHHAGAMLCMWAGIRYMSPPIWMFVQVNSFIHALMYTYYALSAVNIRVPTRFKRLLTTMQISQFLVGFTFAFTHLYISYTVPVITKYTVSRTIAEVISSATSAVVAAATDKGTLKRLALRALGAEGPAENVGGYMAHASQKVLHAPRPHRGHVEDVLFRTDYQTVHCIDTPGQAFAIWLNMLYLLPLTMLFVRFFMRSYGRRAMREKSQPHPATRIARSATDARRGLEIEVQRAFENGQGFNTPIESPMVSQYGEKDILKDLKMTAMDSAKTGKEKMIKGINDLAEETTKKANAAAKQASKTFDEKVKPAAQQASKTVSSYSEAVKENITDISEQVEQGYEEKVQPVVRQAEKSIRESTTSLKKESSSMMTESTISTTSAKDDGFQTVTHKHHSGKKKNPAAYEASVDEVITKEQASKAKKAMSGETDLFA